MRYAVWALLLVPTPVFACHNGMVEGDNELWALLISMLVLAAVFLAAAVGVIIAAGGIGAGIMAVLGLLARLLFKRAALS